MPHHLSRGSKHAPQYSFSFILVVVYHVDFVLFYSFETDSFIYPRLDPKCHPCLYLQGWDYRSVPLGSYKIINAILRLYLHDFM